MTRLQQIRIANDLSRSAATRRSDRGRSTPMTRSSSVCVRRASNSEACSRPANTQRSPGRARSRTGGLGHCTRLLRIVSEAGVPLYKPLDSKPIHRPRLLGSACSRARTALTRSLRSNASSAGLQPRPTTNALPSQVGACFQASQRSGIAAGAGSKLLLLPSGSAGRSERPEPAGGIGEAEPLHRAA
jgi:hypothetical protein